MWSIWSTLPISLTPFVCCFAWTYRQGWNQHSWKQHTIEFVAAAVITGAINILFQHPDAAVQTLIKQLGGDVRLGQVEVIVASSLTLGLALLVAFFTRLLKTPDAGLPTLRTSLVMAIAVTIGQILAMQFAVFPAALNEDRPVATFFPVRWIEILFTIARTCVNTAALTWGLQTASSGKWMRAMVQTSTGMSVLTLPEILSRVSQLVNPDEPLTYAGLYKLSIAVCGVFAPIAAFYLWRYTRRSNSEFDDSIRRRHPGTT